MVAFLPDMRLFIAPVPSKRAVQRHQTANRVLRDDRAERTGCIRQYHAPRQIFHARVLVRARPGQLQQTQVFGLRQLGFTRFAENNRSRAKLLCGRVFAVLRERVPNRVFNVSRMVKSHCASTKTDVFSFCIVFSPLSVRIFTII